MKPQTFQFGPFCLDAQDQLLLRNQTPLSLPPKAFDTLLYLVRNHGRLVTREELIRAVWPNSYVEDGSLTVNISHLRRTLGEMESGEAYIETVPKRGYRFRSGVTVLDEEVRGSADGPRSQNSEVLAPATLATERRPRSRPVVLILLIGLLTAGLCIYLLRKRSLTFEPFTSIKISRLTSLGEVVQAAISPDARYVAYVLKEAQGQSVWIRQTATPSGTRILAPEASEVSTLVFSPGGDYLYYVRGSPDGSRTLYRVPFLGGEAVAVLSGVTGPIAFSPDGQYFAYIHVDSAVQQTTLLVAKADGSGVHAIATRKRPQYFSPEGIAWLRDGLSIACFEGNATDYFGPAFHLGAVRVANGKDRAITSRGWAWPGSIVSSPDGKALLVLASEQAVDALQIWHVSLADGQVLPVTNDLSNYAALSLAADGKTLVAVKIDASSGLWLTPARDLGRAVLASSNNLQNLNNISWTADGRVVYSARAGGYLSIFLMDGSKHTEQLTLDRGNRFEAVVTPDGRYLLYELGGKIWRMNLDGSDPRQLTFGAHDVHPTPASDSRSVIYASFADWCPAIGGKPTLWNVSIDGGNPKQLTELATSLPQVSPDGKQIAAAYYPSGDPRFSENKIAVFSIAGGKPLRLFDRHAAAGESVDWSPDGSALDYAVTIQGVGNIWRQPISGGPPMQLTHFDSDYLSDLAWSRDGRQLATARGPSIGDIVLIKSSN